MLYRRDGIILDNEETGCELVLEGRRSNGILSFEDGYLIEHSREQDVVVADEAELTKDLEQDPQLRC